MPQGEWTSSRSDKVALRTPVFTPSARKRRREIRDIGMEQLENWYHKRENRRTSAETIRDLNELRMWHLEKALRKNGLWDDDKDGLTGWPGAYGPIPT